MQLFLEPAYVHKLSNWISAGFQKPELGEGGEGACILAELLSWEVAGLCLEAQGHNLGRGPALG